MNFFLSCEQLTHSSLKKEKTPDRYVDIFPTKAKFMIYLKESCLSEFFQQFPFKYFVNLHYIIKVIFKSMTGPDDTCQVDF